MNGQPPIWSQRPHEHKYVDQVVRKEQFLADNPDAVIVHDRDAPPHQHWRGHVPGSDEVTSHDLELLLNRLDHLVAARDAHARWPNWTFSRISSGWQAKQTDGPELVVRRTLEQVEAQVAEYKRITPEESCNIQATVHD